MGNPDPERRPEPILATGVAPERFDSAPPPEIMVKIFGCDAMEWTKPLFQPAVVSIDVVDVQVWRLRSRAAGLWQDTARDFRFAGEADDRLAAIATKLIVRRDHAIKCGRDGGTVKFRQHRVRRRPVPVTRDQNRNLLGGQASLARLAAALARGTRQAGSLALERFQDKGFVGVHDPGELAGFVERRCREKPVTPAERGGRGDTATFRRFRQAFAGDQGLGLRLPTILHAQTRQRCSGQRVETAPAIATAVTLQTTDLSPSLETPATAMRATREIPLALGRCRQGNGV